jgi:hypothetical protein
MILGKWREIYYRALRIIHNKRRKNTAHFNGSTIHFHEENLIIY